MHCGKHPAVRWIPRLRRYKGKFPDPQWPGNAKLCVNIVLNYEEGGGRVQCGQWGRAIGNGPSRVEKEQIEKNIEAIREISSQPPRGWYVGLPSMSSKGLVCHVFEQQGLELLFQCDSYSDELPYWTAYPLGLSKGLLMIPYTYDVNENKFTTSPSFTNPRDWLEYCKAAFDVLYEEDCNGEPKMMTIGLHSRLIGRPARFQALRELVKYIQGREGVWVATREEIARHWIKTHPFNESKLNRIRYFL